uniref:Uncharacterized protein n=1 Tax=Rhodosorus marinus TaxID=101924 RepID=A0A7S0BH21_9RHOD|mmetsp:Transcript_15069/g.22166  ORF Transcript_15069/g.22166 Transcript_15069/m.22166 type:complete len:144 (+) Transcript_15069:39-470(+)
MASLAITGAAGAFAAAAVALKGAVEVQTHFKWDNNVLARQGEGVLTKPSDASRLQQQRAGGIKGVGADEDKEPSFMDKVPRREVQGDFRSEYKTSQGTSFTNNTSSLDDILAAVPKKANGTSEYQKIARPKPKPTSISNRFGG